jgi:hypothetical protein
MELVNFINISGFLDESEGRCLQEQCKDKVVLEIGSLYGKSSAAIAAVAISVHCNDTFSADGDGQSQLGILTSYNDFLVNTKGYPNITPVVGKSLDRVPTLPDEFFDVIFIDADHHHESVIADTLVALPKLKSDGFFLYHDYITWLGVTVGVNALFYNPRSLIGSVAQGFKQDIKTLEEINAVIQFYRNK